MFIRRLMIGDAPVFWHLRMVALQSEPVGFAESTAEHEALGVKGTEARIEAGNDENFVMGAFETGQLIGTAGFYREQKEKRRQIGWIWGVFVHPEHRQQGVGRALICSVVEQARGLNGLAAIHITAAIAQTAARKMYGSLGFRVVGTVPGALYVDGKYYDEEMMALDLRNSAN
ncbi:MAG TPA: GNAT family N-acetyltransferase [Candidatus Aquilonibacter sp.]|nr:GNAT family N-acetyltransferase [Candidatus Aquilonibacter sp.]